MICELHIENIAVIKKLTVELGHGFSVLTGETGAGKSIIIDSVNLLLGGRSTRELIRSGEEKATVSGCFTDIPESVLKELEALDVIPEEDGAVYIQRVMTSDGKTQSKINGRSVPVSVLREAGGILINIHGQHDDQKLLNPEKHIDFLDSYADVSELTGEYLGKYNELLEIRRNIRQNTKSEKEIAERMDTLNFQIGEIDGAKLKEGEEEALLLKRERIRSIEKISRYCGEITSSLKAGLGSEPSASELVRRATDAVSKLADVLPDSDAIVKRLEFCLYEIEDISDTAAELTDGEVGDPEAELDKIESRLELISRLERKYAPDISGIIAFREKAKAELDGLKSNGETVEQLKKEMNRKAKEAYALADKLTEKRKEAAEKLSNEVTAQLHYLDFEKVVFSVSVTPIETEDKVRRFSQRGCDNVEFLISTNPGEPLKSLSKVASGGELSRVMLALKSVLADSDGVQTIIFDEIDTGVSGKTSHKLGIRLSELSKKVQVICITHSALLASCADTHYKISKTEKDGRAETSVRVLSRDERIDELSRIMGGIEITENVKKTASEMLSANGK